MHAGRGVPFVTVREQDGDTEGSRGERMRADREQVLQEDEYAFPYHHIAQRTEGFSQCFNDTWGINYLATIEFLIGKLAGERFDSAIDIGCGDGRFVKELRTAFADARILGVDFSHRAIALAQAMVPSANFRCADITTGLDDGFDLAVLMEVYEHIPPAQCPEFVDAVADLLNPGGILYVTVPHVNKPVEPKHYRHFSSAMLMQEFTARFEVLEMTPIERISIAKWMLDRVLSNRLFILNSRRIGGWLFRAYQARLFLARTEENCQRLVLRMRKREDPRAGSS